MQLASKAQDMTPGETSSQFFRLAAAVFEVIDDGIVVTDAENAIIAVNPAFERVTGYAAGEVIGRNPRILSSGRHTPAFYAEMWETLLTTGRWHGEVWNRRKSGELYVQRLTLSVIRGRDGRIVNHVGVFNDITEAKQLAETASYRAHHDVLTGLPNRILFADRLTQALAMALRENRRLALLFVDLDGFKEINDQFGHVTGDCVLEAVAARMLQSVRDSDTVSRFGGDEFVILLPDIRQTSDAQVAAEKVLIALTEPIDLDCGPVTIGASIGIAVFPANGTTAEALLRNADAAMYAAKRGGKNRYVFGAH